MWSFEIGMKCSERQDKKIVLLIRIQGIPTLIEQYDIVCNMLLAETNIFNSFKQGINTCFKRGMCDSSRLQRNLLHRENRDCQKYWVSWIP